MRADDPARVRLRPVLSTTARGAVARCGPLRSWVLLSMSALALGACAHGASRKTGPAYLGAGSRIEPSHQAIDIEDVFRGQTAGVQVVNLPECGGLTLRVRGGYTSLDGDRCRGDPLVIIDGAPAASVPRALKALQPEWIESVEVLRDVVSTIPYGSRGAHGVIIITLKRD